MTFVTSVLLPIGVLLESATEKDSFQGQQVTGDNFNTRADARTPGADMVRIHWKVKDSQFDFMSARMTREAAQVKAAEMRNDPELYGVEIRED